MLIWLYVADELSYDKFHRDYQNIYRLALRGRLAGQEFNTANTSVPVGPAMLTDIPGVEEMVRVFPVGAHPVWLSAMKNIFIPKPKFSVPIPTFFPSSVLNG